MIEQIRRYTELARRCSEIMNQSGTSWKPEYQQELEAIEIELRELRDTMKNMKVESGPMKEKRP